MSFDEATERDKLAGLDLTEDVVELIIKKKRSNFESRVVPVVAELVDEPVDEIPEPEAEPEPEEILPPEAPPIVETTPSIPTIVRRLLPWQRRRL